jgi:NRAMP (natural resistance-associated macrophage protein)-like metal ion transporter
MPLITAAAVLFAVALLCAGESASITATLAGQIVSEGFLRWKVSVSQSTHNTITLPEN